MSSAPSFHLAVGRQTLAQVDTHCQTKLLAGMFLMDVRLQLEALLIKAVQGNEGQRLFFQEALQTCTPVLQHAGASFRRSRRGSPEDLRGQDLEATVVKDAILQGK